MRWWGLLGIVAASWASPAIASVCSNQALATLDCDGFGIRADVRSSDLDRLWNYQSCSTIDQAGPDRVFEVVCAESGPMELFMGGTACDLDMFLVNGLCQTAIGCLAHDITVGSGTGPVANLTFDCVAGETYYLVVEGWALQANPASCDAGLGYDFSDFTVFAFCDERCGDGEDNDGDALVDCDDPDCTCVEDCSTPGDEDGNGLADCLDPVCAAEPVCCDLDGDGEASALGSCGGRDCDDTDPDVGPHVAEIPVNGVDDDCDGGELCWTDADGDGFGTGVYRVSLDVVCGNTAGESDNDLDCYDVGNGARRAYPGAHEIPGDGNDQNCDGVDHCFRDVDGDGVGAGEAGPGPSLDCAAAPGWSATDGDCLDQGAGSSAAFPGAEERCDGIDNDCDGAVDGDDADLSATLVAFPDVDGDGYGVMGGQQTVVGCDLPPGFAVFGGDCDDSDGGRNPGLVEVPYDGIDQDCQQGDLNDIDGDGVVGPSTTGPDCDDNNPLVNPSRRELANGLDDNCDGQVDEVTDRVDDDGDGFAELGGDCDDSSASISPVGIEVCNGLDDNCDGTIDEHTPCRDDDGDGYSEDAGDCNDLDPSVSPAMTEDPTNGRDDDCDGFTDQVAGDEDGDGFADFAGDCDDTDPAISPLAVELDNGIDDNCNGRIDEGTERYDDDGDGVTEVGGDCHDGDRRIYPGATEIHNGIDDDCDGRVDDVGESADDDQDGWTLLQGDCNDNNPQQYPGAVELDDNLDNNCDGEVDEGLEDLDGDGWATIHGDCDDHQGWAYPAAPEVCDGIDNNCDGFIDEGCAPPVVRDETGDPSGGCQSGPRGGWMLLAMLMIRRRRMTVPAAGGTITT